ncbi:unnamed protein product, partial [Urochloa humidicola]
VLPPPDSASLSSLLRRSAPPSTPSTPLPPPLPDPAPPHKIWPPSTSPPPPPSPASILLLHLCPACSSSTTLRPASILFRALSLHCRPPFPRAPRRSGGDGGSRCVSSYSCSSRSPSGSVSRVLLAGGAQGPWPALGFDGLRDDEPLIKLDRSQYCPHPRRHRRLPSLQGILHKHLLRSMGTLIVDKVLITLAAASVLVYEKRKKDRRQGMDRSKGGIKMP